MRWRAPQPAEHAALETGFEMAILRNQRMGDALALPASPQAGQVGGAVLATGAQAGVVLGGCVLSCAGCRLASADFFAGKPAPTNTQAVPNPCGSGLARDMIIAMTTPHSAHLRKGRHSQPGQTYLLTTATASRLPVFADFTLARLAIGALRECDQTGESKTLAFVLMPDHLHWLFVLHGANLSATARRFKSVAARRINHARSSIDAALWQRGFHDRALRREEDLAAVARYIVANPLRAGLVNRIGNYPHWDAVWL
jgi:putative transposase